jgi:hypothetical protein
MCSNGVRWRNSKMCHPFRMVNKTIDMALSKGEYHFFFSKVNNINWRRKTKKNVGWQIQVHCVVSHIGL